MRDPFELTKARLANFITDLDELIEKHDKISDFLLNPLAEVSDDAKDELADLEHDYA